MDTLLLSWRPPSAYIYIYSCCYRFASSSASVRIIYSGCLTSYSTYIPGISQEVHLLDELSPHEGQINVQRASITLQRVQATRRHSWPDRRASVVFGGMAALQICREMVDVRRVLKAAVSRGLDQATLVGRGHKYRWGCPQSCAFLTCPPREADERHVKI